MTNATKAAEQYLDDLARDVVVPREKPTAFQHGLIQSLVAEIKEQGCRLDQINQINGKLIHDTGKGCSVCGETPVVNVPGGSGTYWLCGGCVGEKLENHELAECRKAIRDVLDTERGLSQTETNILRGVLETCAPCEDGECAVHPRA